MTATSAPCTLAAALRSARTATDDVRAALTGPVRAVKRSISPDRPFPVDRLDQELYADFATLRGDASDGLPGVASVGEKTAATLLGRHGDIAGIVEAAQDPSSGMGPGPRGKIKVSLDYLAVAPQVVAVRRDLAVDANGSALPSEPADAERFAALVEQWGLERPAERLLGVLAGGAGRRLAAA